MSQGMRWPLEVGKCEKMDYPLGPPESKAALPSLDFSHEAKVHLLTYRIKTTNWPFQF